MMLKLLVLCLTIPLMSGCANSNLRGELKSINSQPYIADSIEVHTYEPIELAPLTVVDSNPSSLLRRHEQHKLDRQTIKDLDQALSLKSKQLKLLRTAMKNIEVADRATQRSNVYLKKALEEEQRASTFNTIKHTLFEVILSTLFLLK